MRHPIGGAGVHATMHGMQGGDAVAPQLKMSFAYRAVAARDRSTIAST